MVGLAFLGVPLSDQFSQLVNTRFPVKQPQGLKQMEHPVFRTVLSTFDAERVQGDDIVRGQRADGGPEDREGAAARTVLRGVSLALALAALPHDQSRQHGRTDLMH